MLQTYAVPYTAPQPQTRVCSPSLLAQYGTLLCSDHSVVAHVREALVNNINSSSDVNNNDVNNNTNVNKQPAVIMLGSFHKRGEVEILDPSRSRDPSSYDKCYWLVYYSVVFSNLYIDVNMGLHLILESLFKEMLLDRWFKDLY